MDRLERSRSEPRPVDGGHDRFGVFTLTGLVVASMIGAGVFTTSGFALADLGTPGRVLWAWVVGGAVALFGAASYGLLARCMAGSGGEYLYLSRSVHPMAGFIAGWVSLLAGFTGAIAFAATTMEAYLLSSASRPGWLPTDSVAVTAIILAAALHGLRARLGAITQNLSVALKLIVLGLFAVFGALFLVNGGTAKGGATSTPELSLPAFAMSVVWISLSYSGFNAAVYVAGEARDAGRTVPRALLLGTLAVTALYLGLNAVFVLAPAHDAVAGTADVATAAARHLGGESLAIAAQLVIALALFTSVSAMLMAGPRVYARMAADGLMPALFSFDTGIPRAAIALQALLAILVVLVSGLQDLLSWLGFTLSLSAAASVGGLFAAHARAGSPPVTSRLYPWVPALYIAATLGLAALAAVHDPLELGAALVTLIAGAAVYALVGGRR